MVTRFESNTKSSASSAGFERSGAAKACRARARRPSKSGNNFHTRESKHAARNLQALSQFTKLHSKKGDALHRPFANWDFAVSPF
jgi:hypothetical protein